MDHEWVVDVKDETGAAVTNAKKVVVAPFNALLQWPFTSDPPSATHSHTSNGTYLATAPTVPAEGFWILIVLVDGKSPVTQPFKMKAGANGEFLSIPITDDTGNPPRTASTVDLAAEKRTVAGKVFKRIRFGVTVFPMAEIVLVTGVEFEGHGTNLRIFAQNWIVGMHQQKKIDDGTIVTLFSCDERSRFKLVPAKGGQVLQVDGETLGSTAGITIGKDHRPVPPVGPSCQDVSVVTLYKYLDSVGKSAPGTVREVGFFTHSWVGGPLLFDTDDHSTTTARDPNDFDARAKDFLPDNVSPATPTDTSGWPDMKKALATAGKWHTWGCSATTVFHDQVIAAQQNKPGGDLAFFTVPTTLMDNSHTITIARIQTRTNRASVLALMDRQFRGNSYAAAAAAFLGMPVFAAPPGMGSSFGSDGFGREFMFVNKDDNGTAFAYFAENFGPEFTPTSDAIDKGYVDYNRVASRTPVGAPAFSSEAFQLTADLRAGTTTLLFANNKGDRLASVTVNLKGPVFKTDFTAVGMTGHFYELDDTSDATKSKAYFMHQDGRLFKVTQNAVGGFTILGGEL